MTIMDSMNDGGECTCMYVHGLMCKQFVMWVIRLAGPLILD